MVAPLVLFAIKQLPGIILWIRERHATQHPGEPLPTDAEVIAAFNAACDSSLAKDALWLSQHGQHPER